MLLLVMLCLAHKIPDRLSIHDRGGLSFDAKRDGILEAAFEAPVILEGRNVFGPRTDRRFNRLAFTMR
jgi:hypothetical protein